MTARRSAGPTSSSPRYRVLAFDLTENDGEPVVDVTGVAIYVAAIWIEGTRLITEHHPIGPDDMLERLRGYIDLEQRDPPRRAR